MKKKLLDIQYLLGYIVGMNKMKAHQVIKQSYDGYGQVGAQPLDTFSTIEYAQAYINEYVEKRGGIERLSNDFGGRGSVELVIKEVDDFYID